MNQIWDKVKWFGTHALWLIAGLVLLIDPAHIDRIVAAHPKWAGAILFVWTALLSWAQRTKPQPQPDTYPPGTGQNPMSQSPTQTRGTVEQKSKPYTKGLVG